MEDFVKEVRRIADDYIPDRIADAPLALAEMREALLEALAKAEEALKVAA